MPTYIVNNGLAIATGRLKGVGAEPIYASWGTGGAATLVSDTTLSSEVVNNAGAGRVAGTSSQVTSASTVTNDTYQVTAALTAASGITVTNAGLFQTVTLNDPTLFMKGDFTGITLAALDSLQLTFKVVASTV